MLSATDPDGLTMEEIEVTAVRPRGDPLSSAVVAFGLDLERLTRPSLGTGQNADGLEEVVVTASRIRRGGAGGGGGGTDGGGKPQENQSDIECRSSSWNIGGSFGAYAGPGAEFKGGNDKGNDFGTLRVGLGIGGGGSIDRAPSIPGPEFDRHMPGWVIGVSYDFAVSWGPLDFGLSAGAARNLTSHESSPDFDWGVSGGGGTKLQISLGAEITHYRPRETCRAQSSVPQSGR